MSIVLTSKKLPSSNLRRILSGIIGQKKASKVCPDQPRLDGLRALVTGGTAGIGEFISQGLLERGASITTMARGQSKGTGVLNGIHSVQVDLADPDSIVSAVDTLDITPFDLIICNAGLILDSEQLTSEEVEKTFAINVLGHHILYRLLMERGLLSKNAKIIMTTGDIYIMEDSCSINIPFDSRNKTYARSKLGNLWQVTELTKRYPDLQPIAVHPGVVASGFAGDKQGFLAKLRERILISEDAGAQASLIAATQDLPRGAYWHNVQGIVDLQGDDPALNSDSAQALWEELELFAAPYLK